MKSKWRLLVLLMMIDAQLLGQAYPSPVTSYNINHTLYVDGVKYPQSPDIGVGIAAAYADLPSNGGTIVIPAAASCYTMSTAVVFKTASKPVIIDGVGGACINFISTSGTAFTFNNGDLTNHFRSGGILNIVLNGPNSGVSTAILLGGTNGAERFYLTNSKVNWPFGTGITFGNNTWGTLFDHSTITGTPGINFPLDLTNSGEDIEIRDTFMQGQGNNFTNCAIFNGGTGLALPVPTF